VVLARLDLVDPVVPKDLAEDRRPGDDHRRALRLEPWQTSPLVEWKRGEAVELRVDRIRAQAVSLDQLRLALHRAEVQSGQRGPRAGTADRPVHLPGG